MKKHPKGGEGLKLCASCSRLNIDWGKLSQLWWVAPTRLNQYIIWKSSKHKCKGALMKWLTSTLDTLIVFGYSRWCPPRIGTTIKQSTRTFGWRLILTPNDRSQVLLNYQYMLCVNPPPSKSHNQDTIIQIFGRDAYTNLVIEQFFLTNTS